MSQPISQSRLNQTGAPKQPKFRQFSSDIYRSQVRDSRGPKNGNPFSCLRGLTQVCDIISQKKIQLTSYPFYNRNMCTMSIPVHEYIICTPCLMNCTTMYFDETISSMPPAFMTFSKVNVTPKRRHISFAVSQW